MSIRKVKIKNFKCFEGEFEVELNRGINILVGNNAAGKSTILEAIHLALTGLYCGRSIRYEVSQYMFNKAVVDRYIESTNSGNFVCPPEIYIEIYFDGSIDPVFEGNGNSEDLSRVEGVKFRIFYDDRFDEEYKLFTESKNIGGLPIEYYDIEWTSFARSGVTVKNIPLKSVLIDSSNYRYQNGSDVYISRIVRDLLSPEDLTSISQAHRVLKESFIENEAIIAINERINKESSLVEGKVSLGVDLGTKNAWENSLVTQLDDIPFGYIGKGAQCILKTELALTHKKAQKAQIVLLEEPESHLSFSKLSQLIASIEKKYGDKQLIISTHSSFVANKLGLDNLLLLKDQNLTKITNLKSSDFFKKSAGFDTLRMILCKKAILVEGASDELIVQKAYMDSHKGRLPIFDQVDVISVGISFLRFLELANVLNINTVVVTDNDGNIEGLERKYNDYIGCNKKEYIKICYSTDVDSRTHIGDKPYNYNTLEPKLLEANGNNLDLFNNIFGTNYDDLDKLRVYMKNNKTECAMSIFDTSCDVKFPNYILEAITDGE